MSTFLGTIPVLPACFRDTEKENPSSFCVERACIEGGHQRRFGLQSFELCRAVVRTTLGHGWTGDIFRRRHVCEDDEEEDDDDDGDGDGVFDGCAAAGGHSCADHEVHT